MALGVVGLLIVVAYRAAESAVSGVAATAAAVNHIAAWVATVVVLVAVMTAAVWLLLGRRRAVRDAPIEAAFHARVQAALDAGEQTIRTALGDGPTTSVAPVAPALRVPAVRPDRLDTVGGSR